MIKPLDWIHNPPEGAILVDRELRAWAETGIRSTFFPEQINPASVDLRLGWRIRAPRYVWRVPVLKALYFRCHLANPERFPLWGEEIQARGYILRPGGIVLASTVEITEIPLDCAGVLLSKSSPGRRGLQLLHVGWGDPGFFGTWTFELINVAPWPIVLEPNKPIVQLVLVRLTSVPDVGYRDVGHYQGQVGPRAAVG